MRANWFIGSLSLLAIIVPLQSAAIDRPVLMRESGGDPSNALSTPCALGPNTNGTCANYRWYNTCSHYIWIWPFSDDREGIGVLFGGPQQPCVAPGNRVKRVITYFRDILPRGTYAECGWDISVDRDNQGDGCPDGTLASWSYRESDLGSRWNCKNLDLPVPQGVSHLIVRLVRRTTNNPYEGCEPSHGPPFWSLASIATDGPFSDACDPFSTPHSFYYGIDGSTCVPWEGPTAHNDNFLMWLVMGSGITATETTTWGAVKSLYH